MFHCLYSVRKTALIKVSLRKKATERAIRIIFAFLRTVLRLNLHIEVKKPSKIILKQYDYFSDENNISSYMASYFINKSQSAGK